MNAGAVAILFVAMFLAIGILCHAISNTPDSEFEAVTKSYELQRVEDFKAKILVQQEAAKRRYEQMKQEHLLRAQMGQTNAQNQQNALQGQAANANAQNQALMHLMSQAMGVPYSTLTGGVTIKSKPEPEPELPKSQQTDVILGWRTWKVTMVGSNPILQSVVAKTLWPWGEPLESVTNADTPAAPASGYGIYAARNMFGGMEAQSGYRGIVYGRVALWGKVIEHERGYRAQFAYPQHLWCEDEKIAQGLRRLYGCEVSVE